MSVPLDRLYNHIDSLCDHDIIIYRFFPHGSKKLEDLTMLKAWSWFEYMTLPMVICHDQEPLNFDLYTTDDIAQTNEKYNLPDVMQSIAKNSHIRGVTSGILNVHDQTIILHSEKNSSQVHEYEQHGFVGAYWWSHAAIARDWFRYAEHDLDLSIKHTQKDFLIYNRAWSGTREYRIKFAELLVQNDLVNHCNTKFSSEDSGQHYTQHKFNNAQFRPNCEIEKFIPANNYHSAASADYTTADYQSSGIEVVLETLFDDTRWHLTEKSLRPIACGKPFILASTPGSLKYLQSYGFETFSPLIDESYDMIQDPIDRMQSIVAEMKRISQLDTAAKTLLYQQLDCIAARNKAKFFSGEWQQQIFNELVTNLNSTIERVSKDGQNARAWKLANPVADQKLIGTKLASTAELERFKYWLQAKGV